MLARIRRNSKAVVVVLIGGFVIALVCANSQWFITFPDYILLSGSLAATGFLAWRRPRFWLLCSLAICAVAIPGALWLRNHLQHDIVLLNRTGLSIKSGRLSLGGPDDFFSSPSLDLEGFPANMRFTIHLRSWELRGEYFLSCEVADGTELFEVESRPVQEYGNWMRIELLPSGVVAIYRKE